MRRQFFLLFIFPIIHCYCPDGFELVASGQCRLSQPIVMNLNHPLATNTAISKCKEIQSNPVIIHNDEQQSYWQMKATGIYLVLGIICNTTSLKWMWSDGSPIDYKPSAGYKSNLDSNCDSSASWLIDTDVGYWDHWIGTTEYDSFDIYCTTQLPPLPVPNADGCETFEDDNEDGICYQVGAVAENWQEAQVICGSFGATVASVHNEKENSFIRRLAVSKGAVIGMYLGASVSGKGNDFSWIDGSNWDYTNFYQGFPMNGLGECLIMDTGSATGEWANVDCSTKVAVACERKQHYTAPACPSGPFVEGQVLFSPGFPNKASTPCDFILSVDSGKKIELEVLLVEANTCCDHLIVYENYFGGTIIANLTGEVHDTKYTTSSSNFMRVSWQPNGGVNVRGAMFTYRSV